MFETRDDLSTDNILSRKSDLEIFKYYCQPFKQIGEKFKSELRDNDSNSSCIISYYDDKLWYKDFGEIGQKAVDCFGYIMRKYSLTFLQALGTINLDFNLGLKNYVEYPPSLNYVGLPDKQIVNLENRAGFNSPNSNIKIIKPTYRNWLELDIKYWKYNYYLDIPRLEFFEIRPISKLNIEGTLIDVEMPTYNYLVDKEQGIDIVKVYSPFGRYKWISNCKSHHYLGYNQLPWTGDNIVITKSLKDVAVLSLFKLPAIAPQSEAQVISQEMYEKLSRRFTNFYILYDNDKAGVAGAEATVETFNNIKSIFIPKESGEKDISDFINRYRFRATEKLVKELI